MRHSFCRILLLALPAGVMPAQVPWEQVTVPSLRDVAANFKAPPHEYGAIQPFTSWNGPDAAERRERIVQDLDRLAANQIFVVNVSPGRGEPLYLTPEHMDQMKFVVEQAAQRGMKIWLQDESDYPSGFAGGKIKQQYPQLCMQGIVADIRVHVAPGQTLTMPAPPDTLAIFATKSSPDRQVQGVVNIPVPADGQLKWTVPYEGSTPNEPRLSWEVVFVRHIYISSPTRSFNREDGTRAKDAYYSLIDYLDADATRAFLKITHETYYQAIGNAFGKTVLGFFGDEPDYSISGYPWTPKLLEEFRRRKGYDLAPYLPAFFSGMMTEEARRAKADYYDVWSSMFQNTFFGTQADWCARHNVAYLVHLNHEETMTALVRSEGDFFRDMRYVQVPGIDNLNQLVPNAVHRPDGTWNVNNNFPKLASSAAHLFGRSRVWSEEGGGTGIDGKFQLDFQLVRGVNALQIRVPVRGFGGETSAPAPPQAAMLAAYANRGGYLMSIGRPAAQVALYHPANSIWMGDDEADRSTTKLGWQLLEHQVDWDYFDEQSLSSLDKIEDGGFKNLSGQVYRAVVFPSSSVITRAALDRLRAFVKAGGKVIFAGKTPRLVVDKTFLNAKETPDLGFATLIEPSGDITPRVLAALPKPDVTLESEFPRLTYSHRRWRDADMYFFFNESAKEESRTANLDGHGQAQVWDLATGEIHPIAGAAAQNGSVKIPLVLAPYEAKVVVVGLLPPGVAAPEPSSASGMTLAELGGDWSIDLAGKQVTSPLKSWEDLGLQTGGAPATYRKQFTATPVEGKRAFLELGDVREYARVKLNGKDLEARAWQPYRWDVTDALKPGTNELEIEVRAAGGGRAGAQPAQSGAGAGRRGNAAPHVYGSVGGIGGRGAAPRPVDGLLGPVRLVAY